VSTSRLHDVVVFGVVPAVRLCRLNHLVPDHKSILFSIIPIYFQKAYSSETFFHKLLCRAVVLPEEICLCTTWAQFCRKMGGNRLVWNQYITKPKEKMWGNMAYYISTVWKSEGTRPPCPPPNCAHGVPQYENQTAFVPQMSLCTSWYCMEYKGLFWAGFAVQFQGLCMVLSTAEKCEYLHS